LAGYRTSLEKLKKSHWTTAAVKNCTALKFTPWLFIGTHPDINGTSLAKIMGVTKGAISQVIKKLEKKKLVDRYQNPTNNKEILLRLTKKGEIDYHGHEAYHAKYDSQWFEALEKITPEQNPNSSNTCSRKWNPPWIDN